MKRLGVFALMAVMSLFTTVVFAQNATTSLRGVVKDPSGAVIPGATVTLVNTADGQTLTATSKGDGEYQLLQITPAKYTITIKTPGFADQTKTAELLVNKPATVNFSLSVKSNGESVDVSISAQTLNTTDASLGSSKDNAEIQALPSETRNVADLLALQPGVLYFPPPDDVVGTQDGRSGSVNGGRSDQGNVTVDGVDDNDQVNGYAFFGVLRETQDSTEEFNVTTGNGNADEGRSSGAQISLITKAGTNKYHGAAYEYFRPSNTVSNDFFLKQAQVSEGQFCSTEGALPAATCAAIGANRPPKKIRNIFGVDIGGPIVKDKLFFFVNYEGQRQAEDSIVVQETALPQYAQGNISYQGDLPGTSTPDTTPSTPSGQTTPAGTFNIQTLTAANLALVDANNGCSVCNTSGYMNGPGVDMAALAYIDSMPLANGLSTGDGYNTGSYTFASPFPRTQNTTIVKIDYIPSEKQHLFARGNLQKDVTIGQIWFPGQPPSYKLEDNSKGMTFGDTWTISSNVVNDIRYGYIRQGNGQTGLLTQDTVDFAAVSSPTAETTGYITSVPVNNIIDNLNISRGKHDIEIGANWRLVHQNYNSNNSSYNYAYINPYWQYDEGAPDPSSVNPSADPVDTGFSGAYEEAYADLVGSVPEVYNEVNYKLTSATSGTLLGDGVALDRHYKANEYEAYIQDAWHIKPNLTMTFGLRYSLLQTPWETKGQEVSPTINTDAWYQQREASAQQGQIYEPALTFAPAGKYYGKPGLYPERKNDIAPRFAIVYAPDNKTSIRAGVGIYFDHFGEALVNSFDQNGAAGLSNTQQNAAGYLGFDTAPRFTGRNNIPVLPNTPAIPPVLTYPYTPPIGGDFGFDIDYGIDNRLKTPYTEAFDLSIQRVLPAGFTLEANYVGRTAKHVIQSLDLAAPVDYVDPQGGGDYYSAGKKLAQMVDYQNGVGANCPASAYGFGSCNPQFAHVTAIPYFEHVFSYMKNLDYNGESATQAVYTNEYSPDRVFLGETTALANIDFYCYYGCPAGHQSVFWSPQFSSLFALTANGISYYNSLQVTLHHPTYHGLQFDVNYTLSKSEDWGSDVERRGANGGNTAIVNTWSPALNKAPSDFDTKSLVTGNVVDQLPFGKGRAYFAKANPVVDALIGGWQLSGIFRYSSALPFSFYEPGYTTNYDDDSFAVNTGGLKGKKYLALNTVNTTLPTATGTANIGLTSLLPQYFPGGGNAANYLNGGLLTGGAPLRVPYPGEAGQRNNFRGDGYLELDTAFTKQWKFREIGALKFTWEVYNVTNAVRFDPESINSFLESGSTVGTASAELTVPRRMQFSLRYDF